MKCCLKTAAIVCALILGASVADAVIPLEYYRSLNGKKGRELKNAICELVSNNVTVLSYGSGSNSTWWGFYLTDRYSNNEVIDRYSQDVSYFGNRGTSVSGMNIEHTVANSWWGKTKNQAYKDLFELMPCEAKINSTKSNYGMGIVVSGDRGNGYTKVGKDSSGQWIWEPADEWKGDFARGYFYIFSAYQNLDWQNEQCLYSVDPSAWTTLKEWAYTLYIDWAKNDPVTEIEVNRNYNVESIQGNRNPFVDFPNLMEYVWGDSIAVPFPLKTTVKSAPASGDAPDPVDPDPVVTITDIFYSSLLGGEDGGFTTENITLPAGMDEVWTITSKYGWKGTAYDNTNKKNQEADAILWTPEIDLTEYNDVRLEMQHAVNFCKVTAPDEVLSVIVREEDGTETEISLENWPAGSSWDFTKTTASLAGYSGKKVQIGFHYTSSTSQTPTWEINEFYVRGVKNTSDIGELPGDLFIQDTDFMQEAEFYTIDGRRILHPENYRGIVIVRRGSRATKTYLR